MPQPDSDNANRAALGGKAAAIKLSAEERKSRASIAARERWRKAKERKSGIMTPGGNAIDLQDPAADAIDTTRLPVAKWPGVLSVGNTEIPVYVLDDGRRVVSRTGATTVLTDSKGGGNLESYIQVRTIEKYMPSNLPGKMIDFEIQEVVNKSVKGMDAEVFLEICGGYVKAWQDGALEKSAAQTSIAMRSAMFLAACSKVGLIALIDEATGYQHQRAKDELQLKLKLYLLEEMRKWERTFPVELWEQFGRLTNWRGSVNQRPKFWGKLVMEFVYEYLDPDVAKWLRENAPRPQHGQNYHQWLTEQYGLKKLVEHIWKVIGIASTCETVDELRKKMRGLYGKVLAYKMAVRFVRESEETGQEILFDPVEFNSEGV